MLLRRSMLKTYLIFTGNKQKETEMKLDIDITKKEYDHINKIFKEMFVINKRVNGDYDQYYNPKTIEEAIKNIIMGAIEWRKMKIKEHSTE